MKKKVLTIFGTRPEALKLIPVIKDLEKQIKIESVVCTTGQHQELLSQVLEGFGINVHYKYNCMTENQSLSKISIEILEKIDCLLKRIKPDLVIVQGDTVTTFMSTLAAHYHQIPVAHVEAGLRTNQIYSPWPEEGYRKAASVFAHLHFAPSLSAELNLLKEGVPRDKIILSGNTIIDMISLVEKKIKTPFILKKLEQSFSFLDPRKKLVLVTGHRRETFGKGFRNICKSLIKLSQREDIQIVFPLHLNPNVKAPITKMLSRRRNIFIMDPLPYMDFVYLMKCSHFIISDSGGIQEEASYLRKPILVTRERTERLEALAHPDESLVGSNARTIFLKSARLMDDALYYNLMSQSKNPYGDGRTASKIVSEVMRYLGISIFSRPTVRALKSEVNTGKV